jgi:hypothetical protein
LASSYGLSIDRLSSALRAQQIPAPTRKDAKQNSVYAAVFKLAVIGIIEMSRVNNIISLEARRQETEQQHQTEAGAPRRHAANSRTSLSEIRTTLQRAAEELAKTLER